METKTCRLDDDTRALLLVVHDQSSVEEALQLIRGANNHAVTIAWITTHEGTPEFEENLSAEGIFHKWHKIPGADKGRISFRWARLLCSHKDAPWPRGWVDHTPNVLPSHASNNTCVVRISTVRHFVGSWNRTLQQPGQMARAWCRQVFDAACDDIMDTRNFQCMDNHRIQGFVRVRSEAVARTLVEASGVSANNSRWFVDLARDVLPDIPRKVAWLPWDGAEDWDQYVARARRNAPFGLVHGKYQIGVRCEDRDARLVSLPRRWWCETTPRFWDVMETTALLESLGFCEVEMLSKAQRRKGAAWLFKAVRHDDLDHAQTQVNDYDIHVVKDAKRKPSARIVKPLANEGRVKFTQPGRPAPHGGRLLGPTEESTVSDETMSPRDGPESNKRRCVQSAGAEDLTGQEGFPDDKVWCPSLGTIIANDGGGDCLWLSLAAALSHFSGKNRSHRQLRAYTVDHMRRHIDDCSHAWDSTGPRGQEFDGDFMA